jgi:hypothetical protein
MFPQVGWLLEQNSHRRGHWFDPSIAHCLFFQVSGLSTIIVGGPLTCFGSKLGANDLDHTRST